MSPFRSRLSNAVAAPAVPNKGRLAILGQLYAVDATIVRIALASDQPVGLHRVEVMGQGRPLDPQGLGELTLVGEAFDFSEIRINQVDEEPPAVAKASSNARLTAFVGAGQMKADGWAGRRTHPHSVYHSHRHRTL